MMGSRLRVDSGNVIYDRTNLVAGTGYIDIYYLQEWAIDKGAVTPYTATGVSTGTYSSRNSRCTWQRIWYDSAVAVMSVEQYMTGELVQPLIDGLLVYLPYSGAYAATALGTHTLVLNAGSMTLDTGVPVATATETWYVLDDGAAGYIYLQIWKMPSAATWTFNVTERIGI